jgi:uncharacterized protein YlxP (DUF503 family)
MNDEAGFVGVLVVDLHFPEAGSLKGKRKELSSIKAQMKGRLGAAVAEVEYQDLWQRSRLTAAFAAASASGAQGLLDGAQRWLDARWPECVSCEQLIVSLDDLRSSGVRSAAVAED